MTNSGAHVISQQTLVEPLPGRAWCPLWKWLKRGQQGDQGEVGVAIPGEAVVAWPEHGPGVGSSSQRWNPFWRPSVMEAKATSAWSLEGLVGMGLVQVDMGISGGPGYSGRDTQTSAGPSEPGRWEVTFWKRQGNGQCVARAGQLV